MAQAGLEVPKSQAGLRGSKLGPGGHRAPCLGTGLTVNRGLGIVASASFLIGGKISLRLDPPPADPKPDGGGDGGGEELGAAMTRWRTVALS